MAETSVEGLPGLFVLKGVQQGPRPVKAGLYRLQAGCWESGPSQFSSAESSWWCSCACSPCELNKKKRPSKIVVRRIEFLLRKEFEITGNKRGALEKVCRRRTAKSTRKIAVQAGFEGEVRAELDESGHFAVAVARSLGAKAKGTRFFAGRFSVRRRRKSLWTIPAVRAAPLSVGPASRRTLRISRRPSFLRTAGKSIRPFFCFGGNEFDAGILQLACIDEVSGAIGEDEEVVVGGLHDTGFGERRSFESRITRRSVFGGKTTTTVSSAVTEYCADAGQQASEAMAHTVNHGAGFFAGDPVRFGALPVSSQRLGRASWPSSVTRTSGVTNAFLVRIPASKGLVEPARFFFTNAGENFDAAHGGRSRPRPELTGIDPPWPAGRRAECQHDDRLVQGPCGPCGCRVPA